MQSYKKPEQSTDKEKKDDSMKKSQYDHDGDGIVDNAKALDGKGLDFITNRSNHTGDMSADNVKDGQYHVAYTLQERNDLKKALGDSAKVLSAEELFEKIKSMPEFISIMDEIKKSTQNAIPKEKPLKPEDVIKAIASKGLLFLSKDDKDKLDGIQEKADQTPGRQQLKQMYESNHDTNAFTDDHKKKLESIKDVGEKNPTATQIRDAYEGLSDRNAFTDKEREKLSKIEDGAEKNVGAEKTPYSPNNGAKFANDVKFVAQAIDELAIRQVIAEQRYIPVNTVFEVDRNQSEVVNDGGKWKKVVRISAKDLPKGRYSVQAYSSIRGEGARDVEVQVRATIDDAHTFSEMQWSPKSGNKIPFSGFEVIEDFQGDHTFEVSIRVVGAGEAYASNSRILLRREG